MALQMPVKFWERVYKLLTAGIHPFLIWRSETVLSAYLKVLSKEVLSKITHPNLANLFSHIMTVRMRVKLTVKCDCL